MMKNKEQGPINHDDFNSLFGELKSDLTSYTKNRLDYIKLDLIENSSKLIAKLSVVIAFVCISMVAFSFLMLTLGLYFGQLLDNFAAGFGLLVLIWLFLLLIIYLCRVRLKRMIRNRCLRALYKMQKGEDQDE